MSWKIVFVKVAWLQTKNCIKIRGSRTIHGIFTSLAAKQVCLGPMKSATCFLFPTARVASRVESYLTGYICFGYPCISLNGDCAFSIFVTVVLSLMYPSYRDQFAMLSEGIARERFEMEVREKAQEKVSYFSVLLLLFTSANPWKWELLELETLKPISELPCP